MTSSQSVTLPPASGLLRVAGASEIWVGNGEAARSAIGDELRRLLSPFDRPLLVLDEQLPSSEVLMDAASAVSERTGSVHRQAVRKSVEGVAEIWSAMSVAGSDVVVVAGGGTALDVGGFAACTYRRGTPRINIPTTYLSAVDATVGGKTGIDFGGVKNSVGALAEPLASICYLDLVTTAPFGMRWAGVSEVVKIGMLYNQSVLEAVERLDPASVLVDVDLAHRAITLKSELVRDAEVSRTGLLFGHNVGHALEALTAMNHGLTVAIGMAVELSMAVRLGYTASGALTRLLDLLDHFGLPVTLPDDVDYGALAHAMVKYKLSTPTVSTLVVPRSVGACELSALPQIDNDALPEALRRADEDLRSLLGARSSAHNAATA